MPTVPVILRLRDPADLRDHGFPFRARRASINSSTRGRPVVMSLPAATAGMEGTEGQWGSRFTNGLGGHDPDGRTDFDQLPQPPYRCRSSSRTCLYPFHVKGERTSTSWILELPMRRTSSLRRIWSPFLRVLRPSEDRRIRLARQTPKEPGAHGLSSDVIGASDQV